MPECLGPFLPGHSSKFKFFSTRFQWDSDFLNIEFLNYFILKKCCKDERMNSYMPFTDSTKADILPHLFCYVCMCVSVCVFLSKIESTRSLVGIADNQKADDLVHMSEADDNFHKREFKRKSVTHRKDPWRELVRCKLDGMGLGLVVKGREGLRENSCWRNISSAVLSKQPYLCCFPMCGSDYLPGTNAPWLASR